MAHLVTLAAVSFAPLLTWTIVEAACALFMLADIVFLGVGLRRGRGTPRLLKALASARKILTIVAPLAVMSLVSYWSLPSRSGPGGDVDLAGFFVGLLSFCGWIALGLSVIALVEGAFALIAPRTVAVDEAAPYAAPETHGRQRTTWPPIRTEAQGTGPSLSPWMETFLALNVIDLALLTVMLFLRGAGAVAGISALERQNGAIATIGLSVFFAVFVAGTSWMSYRSSPRSSIALLILGCALMALVVVYTGLHLLMG